MAQHSQGEDTLDYVTKLGAMLCNLFIRNRSWQYIPNNTNLCELESSENIDFARITSFGKLLKGKLIPALGPSELPDPDEHQK